jgi:hypothetical protein
MQKIAPSARSSKLRFCGQKRRYVPLPSNVDGVNAAYAERTVCKDFHEALLLRQRQIRPICAPQTPTASKVKSTQSDAGTGVCAARTTRFPMINHRCFYNEGGPACAGCISLRKATVKIVLTVSTPKNGSYIVTGAGAGLRLAVNDALREYERTAREKNRPTLNRLAKQQVFTTLQLRLEASEADDGA